ncbi:50S ribosomal protein L6 [Candidatus Gracilibacteria bacterium]|nr:50S ribosomal protein L6 [Candidatus Gracilibacteria bacterium]
MSRIGKLPIGLTENVEVRLEGDLVTVKGPKGELFLRFNPNLVKILQENGQLQVQRKNDTKPARASHGLYRSLLHNMVEGVSNGFSKSLEIKGVGYRGTVQGSVLELSLGYSHPIHYPIPEGVEIKFEEKSQTLLTVSGIDKQLVGQVAAEIRNFRRPEPYKGKGIKYTDERIARKAGKSVAKKGA